MASLFEQWMFEAPEDEVPPDEAMEAPADDAGGDPPDISDDPPDISDDGGSVDVGDPPDIGDDGMDDYSDIGDNPDEGGEENSPKDMEVDEKLSAVLNVNLYQHYTELLGQIDAQLVSIKNNSDILYSISKDIGEVINSLKKLDENVRLYINNNFTNGRYEENLLFYNKCKNLYKLLNDKFDNLIHKGIKEVGK